MVLANTCKNREIGPFLSLEVGRHFSCGFYIQSKEKRRFFFFLPVLAYHRYFFWEVASRVLGIGMVRKHFRFLSTHEF